MNKSKAGDEEASTWIPFGIVCTVRKYLRRMCVMGICHSAHIVWKMATGDAAEEEEMLMMWVGRKGRPCSSNNERIAIVCRQNTNRHKNRTKWKSEKVVCIAAGRLSGNSRIYECLCVDVGVRVPTNLLIFPLSTHIPNAYYIRHTSSPATAHRKRNIRYRRRTINRETLNARRTRRISHRPFATLPHSLEDSEFHWSFNQKRRRR